MVGLISKLTALYLCSMGSTEHVPHALGDFSTEIVGSTVDMRLDICGIGVSVVWGEPPT